MKFKISLHPQEWDRKPPRNQVQPISDEIANYPIGVSLHGLADAIARGKTWTPAIFTNGVREASNFISQQVLTADIDEGNKSKEEMLQDLRMENLTPNLIHQSFSSKEDNKKWRLVFLLDEPLELESEVKVLTKWIANLVEGDYSVADTARLLFGTDKGCEVLSETPVNVDELIEACEDSIFYPTEPDPFQDYRSLCLPETVEELNNTLRNLTNGDKAIFKLMLQDCKDWLSDPSIKGSGYESLLKASIHLSSVSFMPLWGVSELLLEELDKHPHFGADQWRHYSKRGKIIEKGFEWSKKHCELRL